jgi:hypothetical protein
MDDQLARIERILPDRELLMRICQSREFAKSELAKKILRILFTNALREDPEVLSTKTILERCDVRNSAEHVRKEITVLREKLGRFFKEHGEDVTFTIEPKTYIIKFELGTKKFLSAGPMLDLFWLPYLCPDWKVRLMADDFPQFCDLKHLKPKQHWTDSHFEVQVRGDRKVLRGEEYTYLPSGLLRAILKFDRFFALQKQGAISFEYDVSLQTPALNGSVIVIGNNPFGEDNFSTWPTVQSGWRFLRRVSSTLIHLAWEFSDFLPLSFGRLAPAC